MRVFYKDENDELQPSRKGLTISPGLWPQFVKGMELLGVELQEHGLLGEGED